MSVCPECDRVYDESEGGCPWCEGYSRKPRIRYNRRKKLVKKTENIDSKKSN